MSLYQMPERLIRETLRRVILRCPKCKAEKLGTKDQTDPPGTALILLQCPECNDGDFDSPLYFAADGRQLALQ